MSETHTVVTPRFTSLVEWLETKTYRPFRKGGVDLLEVLVAEKVPAGYLVSMATYSFANECYLLAFADRAKGDLKITPELWAYVPVPK
jgi:hypothetical protein